MVWTFVKVQSGKLNKWEKILTKYVIALQGSGSV